MVPAQGGPVPGDRVVVRHRLPAGSSHPLTDALGELLDAGDPLVVRTRDGRLVTVARADVVRLKRSEERRVGKECLL